MGYVRGGTGGAFIPAVELQPTDHIPLIISTTTTTLHDGLFLSYSFSLSFSLLLECRRVIKKRPSTWTESTLPHVCVCVCRSMLFKFREAQLVGLGLARDRNRPRFAGETMRISDCEAWRQDVVTEIARKVDRIMDRTLYILLLFMRSFINQSFILSLSVYLLSFYLSLFLSLSLLYLSTLSLSFYLSLCLVRYLKLSSRSGVERIPNKRIQ